jgi:hypothetical protein
MRLKTWFTPATLHANRLDQFAGEPGAPGQLGVDEAEAFKGGELETMIGQVMHLDPKDPAVARIADGIRYAEWWPGWYGSAPKVKVLGVRLSTGDDTKLPTGWFALDPDAPEKRREIDRVEKSLPTHTVVPLFRVDRVNMFGEPYSQFVDSDGIRYESFAFWRAENTLTLGVVIYPENGHVIEGAGGAMTLKTGYTPATSYPMRMLPRPNE